MDWINELEIERIQAQSNCNLTKSELWILNAKAESNDLTRKLESLQTHYSRQSEFKTCLHATSNLDLQPSLEQGNTQTKTSISTVEIVLDEKAQILKKIILFVKSKKWSNAIVSKRPFKDCSFSSVRRELKVKPLGKPQIAAEIEETKEKISGKSKTYESWIRGKKMIG